MRDNILHITSEDGIAKDIIVLKYFKLKSNNKDYVIYKEDIKQLNNVNVYVAEVLNEYDDIILKEINDNKVLEEIQEIIEEIQHG